MASTRPVRVRFAPSPTGRLHVGGARTALFNWAFARRHGGVFVLRVEDTDTARNTEASLRSILDSLRWLGLDWDEGPEAGGAHGPYFQSQRMGRYREAVERLLAAGVLYRCFCPAERLEALREKQRARKETPRYDRRCRELDPEEAARRAAAGEPCVLRFAVPEGRDVVVEDRIRGTVRFRAEELDDWVAVRSNGAPTYNFTCAVDDAAMAISHVLRGEEHLVNTPKQVLLHEALGQEPPVFAHLPLILGKDGRKLSKRTGDTAVADYRAKGYPPEALVNFLGLLGFALDDHTDLFTPEELVARFDLARVNKAGAVFDPDRLLWISGEYVRRTPPGELAARCRPWLEAAGLEPPAGVAAGAWRERLAAAMRERIRLYSELPERAAFLREPPPAPDEKARKALAGGDARRVLAAVREALVGADAFPPGDFDAWIREVAGQLGLGLGKVLKPMRAALTGTLGGPPVGEVLALLGRERALARLAAGAGLEEASDRR